MAIVFVKVLVCLQVLYFCKARPMAKSDDKVTMAGEPTHFQVDDKAAELEINANAMGVKVNAKPASLQVVSKPGAPAIPVPHPAVLVPQLPNPYPMVPHLPAPYFSPFYPATPMVAARRRTVRRRHHFFDMNPSVGNWNFKKEMIPEKAALKISEKDEHSKQISKKSEISKKSSIVQKSKSSRKSRKRQWIQRIPVLTQMVPLTNIRVHPLVQRLLAESQAAMRNSVPRPIYGLYQRSFLPFSQQSSYISPGYSAGGGDPRSSIHRALFLPALPGYQDVHAISPLMANLHQPWYNPTMFQAPASGVNGYYDPIFTRGLVPSFSHLAMPHVQVPTPRTLIPNEIPGGLMYPAYTPLGLLSKRLTIPHTFGAENNAKHPNKNIQEAEKDKTTSELKSTMQKNDHSLKSRMKRSVENTGDEKGAKNDRHSVNKNAKRQFILTHPLTQPAQQPMVAYVPVVTSAPLGSPTMTAPVPRNFVLSLPEQAAGTYVLNVPSSPQGSQVNTPYSGRLAANGLLNSGQYNVLPTYQPNYVAMAAQRSRINPQESRRYGIPQRINRVPLGELTGIMGTPLVRRGPHVTMFYNGQLPSNVQDEIFRESPLQGRAKIPGRRTLHKHHFDDEDDYETDYPTDFDYKANAYDDVPSSERIEDSGSYTERVLPDGRTVFRKDHVGFGPITVEAHTAESASRHHDDAIDMDLDSDKRKHIPKPESEQGFDRRRLEIPTPPQVEN